MDMLSIIQPLQSACIFHQSNTLIFHKLTFRVEQKWNKIWYCLWFISRNRLNTVLFLFTSLPRGKVFCPGTKNTVYYILIIEMLRNIDEMKCEFSFFCNFKVKKKIFHCSETYFLYFHWCIAELLSSKVS
jgi:hypothetical protein